MEENILQTRTYRTSEGILIQIQIIRLGFHVGPETIQIDGQRPFPAFQTIEKIELSPDGKRLAFLGKSSDGNLNVYVNGIPDPGIEELKSGIFFSEDSGHYSYVARMKNSAGEQRYVVIVDSNIHHDEPYIFGFDAHLNSPGPVYLMTFPPSS